MKKQVFIKTYTSAGVYQGLFYNFNFSSFDYSLNGGLSNLTVVVPRQFDSYNYDGALTLGNELKIYIADNEAPSGVQIYSGQIQSVTPSVSNTEDVVITCAGYIYQLQTDILENAQKVYFKYTSTDPSAILKDVIDKFRAVRSDAKINYGSGTTTIQNTAKSVNLEFYLNTPLEAIQRAASLGNYNWNFRIGVDNLLYFGAIPTSATHLFIMGKDIESLSIDRNIQETKNGILVTNGLSVNDPEYLFKVTKDTSSISTYGRKYQIYRDSRLKYTGGAGTEYANRFINLYKDPLNTVTIKVLDSNLAGGYDIESIKPGDTCKVLNIASNEALTNNMLITKVTYNINTVELTIVDTIKYLERSIFDQRMIINNFLYSDGLPQAYT
jgi:hypothetical protein